MKRTALLLLPLLGCQQTGPCAGQPGTCLTVKVQSGTGYGERVEAIEFDVEGDGAFRHGHRYLAGAGGELLPLIAALPLPDEAQRTIKVHAAALWRGRALLAGYQVLAHVLPGDRRAITITLAAPGGDSGGEARCDDAVQNGGETGVDCGGPCPPCGPSCTDGVKNGQESDADCGGSCAPCYGGQACSVPEDCLSGRCDDGTCARALALASLSPDTGPTTGGTTVTLRGELLGAGMEVLFGITPAALVQAAADGRSAVVTAPPGPPGLAAVTVRRGSESAARPASFAYHYGVLRFGTMPPTEYSPGNKPYYIVRGHFNGRADQHLDLAVINEMDSQVVLYLGRGDGTFDRGGAYAVGRMDGTYPLMAAVADFNGDGADDLVTADNRQPTVSVLLGNGDGTLRPSVQYDLPAGADRAWPPAVATADFNGDGLGDVAVTDAMNGGRAFVLLGAADRSGALGAPQLVAGSDVGARDVDSTLTAGRVDGDTFPDLVVATSARRTARLFLGNGDGTFRAAGESPLGGVGTFTLALADLNGDGKADLLSANRGSDDVTVLLGNGDGSFPQARTVRTGQGPFSLAVGDLDGDGRLDLAAPCYREARPGGSGVTLLFGDGRGGFPRASELLVPATAYGVAAGDYDGDRRLDLAVTSVAPSNRLTIFVNRSQ